MAKKKSQVGRGYVKSSESAEEYVKRLQSYASLESAESGMARYWVGGKWMSAEKAAQYWAARGAKGELERPVPAKGTEIPPTAPKGPEPTEPSSETTGSPLQEDTTPGRVPDLRCARAARGRKPTADK